MAPPGWKRLNATDEHPAQYVHAIAPYALMPEYAFSSAMKLAVDVMGEVMLDWRNILCGVDGSEESLHAAKLGAMIAKRLSSRLLGLCVIPRHQVFQLGIHRAQGEVELEADARALLNRVQNETGFPIEQLILGGEPADTILDIAAKRSCELIVVGRRGIGGVERWLLGSVVTKIVLHAASTVLVSKGYGPVRDTPFQRVLCGLDGSIESERAGIESLGLVALLGGTIRFAHVRNAVKGAEIEPLVGDSTGTFLAKFCEQARQAGIMADRVELQGQPAAVLLEHATGWDASLIAVGTRGLGGFARLRLGSTSHQVVQHAACSVLVCPRR